MLLKFIHVPFLWCFCWRRPPSPDPPDPPRSPSGGPLAAHSVEHNTHIVNFQWQYCSFRGWWLCYLGMCCARPLPLSIRCVVMEIVLLQRTFLGYPLETRTRGKLQLNEWNSYNKLGSVMGEKTILLINSETNADGIKITHASNY